MPFNGWFLQCFEVLHSLRMKLGAPPVHVAEYAKHFGFLYSFLRKSVSKNAVEHARENGYPAVACGHVHFVEDTVIRGVRYLNLGAWTEMPCHCLLIDDGSIRLVTVEDAMRDPSFFVP